MTPERRQSRAKKKTVETPVSTNAHHCQLPATPYCRTCCVTQLGVSLLKVVATIERPASHHGTERPDAKNSVVFFPARRPKNRAGAKQTRSVARTISQSIRCRCIVMLVQLIFTGPNHGGHGCLVDLEAGGKTASFHWRLVSRI